MGGFCSTQITPLPAPKYESKYSGIPLWVSSAGKQIFEQAAEMAGGDFPQYTGARIATFDGSRRSPEERQASDILVKQAGKYKPYLDAAYGATKQLGKGYDQMSTAELLGPKYKGATRGQLLDSYGGQTRQQLKGPEYKGATRRQLTGGPRRGFQGRRALVGGKFGGPKRQELIGESADIGKFSLADAQPYMDIYQRAADPAIEEIRRQAAQQQGQLSAQAAGAGAFGGSRQAIQSAMLGAEGARAAGDLRARAAQEGLGFAAGRFEADRQARMTQAERDRAARFGAESAMMARREAERAARFRAGDVMEQRRQADITSGFRADAALQDRHYKARQLGISVDELMRRQFDADRAARFQAESTLSGQYREDQKARLAAAAAGREGYATEQAALLRKAQEMAGYPGLVRSMQEAVAKGMLTVGQARTQLRQRSLDMAYSDYLDQRQYPFEMLNVALGALKGVPYETKTYGYEMGRTYAQGGSPYGQTIGGLGAVASAIYGNRSRNP